MTPPAKPPKSEHVEADVSREPPVSEQMCLTQERLKELLHYCPDSGAWTWLKSMGTKKASSVAGYVDAKGYRIISVDGRQRSGARLAFLYMTGKTPDIVDHINRKRDDDRWSNLRSVSRSENNQNTAMRADNTSGHTGVGFHKARGRWWARIYANGEHRSLGLHDTAEAAAEAYREAKAKLHIQAADPGQLEEESDG